MDKAGLTAKVDRGGTLPVYIPQYVDVLFEYTYANNVPGEYGFIVRYTNDFDIEDEFIT